MVDTPTSAGKSEAPNKSNPAIQAAIKGQTLLEFNLEMQSNKVLREAIELKLQGIKVGKQSAIEAKNAYEKDKKDIALKREYINVIRDLGASQKELTEVSKALKIPTKMTTDEFRGVWDSFKSGKMKLSEFSGAMKGNFGSALGSLLPKLTAVGVAVAAFGTIISAFTLIQNRNRAAMSGFSSAGGSLTSSIGLLPSKGISEYYRQIGSVLKINEEEMNRRTSAFSATGMVAQRLNPNSSITEKNEFANKAILGSISSIGIQFLAPTMKNTDTAMIIMSKRMGVGVEGLIGGFYNVKKSLLNMNLDSKMSSDQANEAFWELADTMTKFGGKAEGAGKLISIFSKDLSSGTVDISTFKNALTSQGTQSVSKDMQDVAMMKRLGINVKGFKTTGNLLEDASTWHDFSQMHPELALQAKIQSMNKIAIQQGYSGKSAESFKGLLETSNLGMGFDWRSLPKETRDKIWNLAVNGSLTDNILKSSIAPKGLAEKSTSAIDELAAGAAGTNNNAWSSFKVLLAASAAGKLQDVVNPMMESGGGGAGASAIPLAEISNSIRKGFDGVTVQIITSVPGMKARIAKDKSRTSIADTSTPASEGNQ